MLKEGKTGTYSASMNGIDASASQAGNPMLSGDLVAFICLDSTSM